ncbi:hypothetical protein HUJ05_000812 [Dendroctonus ponderosae]|uniref:MADF domain-containing protein n=1 Tax=Dendroctonus ponderosae TaxID=77166 RepID=A0AAR5P8F7_DENPD|nr:hypothetical protein HUJ05_000812 [Dendroctonus ponderosae]
MAEERLIEIVRGHQELYDTKHTTHMKAKLKTRIWCDIAKELKLKDGEEVKNMWVKLRGSYRDAERRKRKSLRSGAAPQKIKPWRFQKQMSFLELFMTTWPREGNIVTDSDNDSPLLSVAETLSQSMKTHDMEMTCEDDGSAQPDSEEFYVTDSVASDGESSRGPETSLPPVINYTPVVRNKRHKQGPYERLKKCMQQREERARKRSEERKKILEQSSTLDDPLYNFYMSMYQLTKQMSPIYQHRVRAQVFQTVSEAEASIMSFPSLPLRHTEERPENQQTISTLPRSFNSNYNNLT